MYVSKIVQDANLQTMTFTKLVTDRKFWDVRAPYSSSNHVKRIKIGKVSFVTHYSHRLVRTVILLKTIF